MTALLASIYGIPVIGPFLAGLFRSAAIGIAALLVGLYIGWTERGNRDQSAGLRNQIETLQENARISARLAETHAKREEEAQAEVDRIKRSVADALSQQAAEPKSGLDGLSGRELGRLCDILGPSGDCKPRRPQAGRGDAKRGQGQAGSK